MFEAMEFASFSEFLDMGGYAFNVWAVYGLFTVFIAANLIAPKLKRKAIIKEQYRRIELNEEIDASNDAAN
ncbi:MAG: heme exporter protein CcmD [Pseudohongiellaceae bacterium]